MEADGNLFDKSMWDVELPEWSDRRDWQQGHGSRRNRSRIGTLDRETLTATPRSDECVNMSHSADVERDARGRKYEQRAI